MTDDELNWLGKLVKPECTCGSTAGWGEPGHDLKCDQYGVRVEGTNLVWVKTKPITPTRTVVIERLLP